MTNEEVKCVIRDNSIVPVATIDSTQKAVPLAKAMIKGGINVIEVTLRTDSALDSIRAISEANIGMCVGAGTVKTVTQCETAVRNGASFIVSPGLSEAIAECCAKLGVLYLPGCVTPTEITRAEELGISTVKYFPANLYDGIKGMKALTGPFPNVSFVPTCGINIDNVVEYVKEPFVLAAGGSWACPKNAIEAEEFDKITSLCRKTKERILGYEVHHFGINCNGEGESGDFCEKMQEMFNLPYVKGNSSDFSSPRIEVKKHNGRGSKGHIAIGTNSIYSAIADLSGRGFEIDEESAVFKENHLIAIYLKNEVFGYALHLSQNT